MKRARVQLGVVAIAAVVLAVVLALVLPFRAQLADLAPRAASRAAEGAEETPVDADAVQAGAASSEAGSMAAVCAPSEPAAPTAVQAPGAARALAEARERLLVSREPEHLAAAALLSRNPRERVDDVTRALATGRNNATLVWTAVRICEAAAASVACPAQQWENELLRLDGENSEVWIHVAVRRLESGRDEAALAALQRAAAAAETREYWPETVELLERGLEAAGGYSFAERVSIAFGIAAANLAGYSKYVRMCEAQSQANRTWADACLRYGETAERQGKTEMGQRMARAIQRAALEVIADYAVLESVQARSEGATTEDWQRVETLIASGPQAFSRYLAKLRESGESVAVAYMVEEAGRWPPPDECVVD